MTKRLPPELKTRFNYPLPDLLPAKGQEWQAASGRVRIIYKTDDKFIYWKRPNAQASWITRKVIFNQWIREENAKEITEWKKG